MQIGSKIKMYFLIIFKRIPSKVKNSYKFFISNIYKTKTYWKVQKNVEKYSMTDNICMILT